MVTRARRRYRVRKSRRRPVRSRETSFLTYDNDFKTDYKYRRMPRGKRKAWRKFSNKVNTVINKGQGLKKHLYEFVIEESTGTGFTNASSAMLYTPDAQVATLNSDMGTLFREMMDPGAFDNANTFGNGDITRTLRFDSAQLEVTWRNTGVHPLIIDLYYVQCRRDFGLTNLDTLNNPEGIFVLGFEKQGIVEDIEENRIPFTNKQFSTQFGTTPFQSSLFCQHFKIITKRKITIAPGNTVSKTLKDPKNRYIEAQSQRAKICRRNQTHGYFWQFYGVPGVIDNVGFHAMPASLTTSVVKRYSYYLPISGKDQTAFGLS